MKFFTKRSSFYILPILFIFLVISISQVFFSNNKSINLFRNSSPTENTFNSPKERVVNTKKIIFLMYHYVEINQNKEDFKRDSLNTLPYVFEEQVLTLKNAGYTFITPSEIPQVLKKNTNEKYVVVSFDDGYRTFYTQTYPIIKKHNIKAINYIIYNFIDKPNNMDSFMISELVKDGLVEIGSHTLNHPDLTSILEDRQRAEIIDSKNLLEKRFNTKVTSFCYPYGFYNLSLFSLLRNAGYSTAVTTKEGSIISEDSLFEIKRIRPGILTGDRLLAYLESINNN